jgi:class 3 adenylate cyclase/predicted ATPase/tRNA A37 threonylcarbamoyladenosine biosynthesis protein TsaE
MPGTRQWCFGPFRLDPTTESLWRDEALLPLPPKPFAVLAYLVVHAGQVVSKETLLEAVWPNTAVTEGVLKTCLGQIRQVLGETARAPQYIATLHRRGYRFVAPVVEYTETVPASAAVSPLETPDLPHHSEVEARPTALSPPAAERRHLTVLCCDLAGAMALAERPDPEEYREVLHAYHQTCTEVMQRFDGYVAQYLGNGVLVYFGYPVAHEDDAQRAIRAGLALLEALATRTPHLALPPGKPLAVRLGVHTGLVVVGDVGVGTRHEPLALGETPNIALRLPALAAPNTLVISAATQQLAAGYFRCKALGAHTLVDLAPPMEVYHVLGASGVQSRLAVAALHGLTPLVGRAQDVALLTERWAHVTEGMGQVVLLTGEAGIGKSRLVQVLIEHVADAGHVWLECQGSPYYQHTALYPLIELLERAVLRFDLEESPSQKLHKLEGCLRQYGLSLAEVVPLFTALLSLPLPAAYAPLSMSPEQQKQHTFHAFLTLLLRMASQQPLLLVMEDLHWVDPSTLEWLSLLVDQGPTTRILALCTYRPDFSPPWTGRAHLTQVTLARLPQYQTTVLTHQVAYGKALPTEVTAQIVAKTDGVPLFVEEVTKTVLESGLLQDQGDHYILTGPLPPLAIPVTLHDSLLARLDRLGAAKGLAQLGATLGREFAYVMLQAVAPWDEETVRRGLQQLVEAELLYQRELPPQATYVFKHALIRDAAYQSLLKRTQQHYHQRIAQVLVAQFPTIIETQPELVAQHYTEAGLAAPAVEYWQRAGQRALQRSANLEAVQHLSMALSLLATLPETSARAQQELDLQIALGPALMAARGWAAPEVEQTYGRARALCTQLGETSQLFPTLWGLWRFYQSRGVLPTARDLGEQLMRLAERTADPIRLLEAHSALGQTLFQLGAYAAAWQHLEQGIALIDSIAQRALVLRHGNAPGVVFLSFAALTLWCLGYPAQAVQRSQEALALAQALDHPFSLAAAQHYAAFLYRHRHETLEVQMLAGALLTLATAQGFPLYVGYGTYWRGWAGAMQGEGEAGMMHMRQGLAAVLATGQTLARPFCLVVLAEVAVQVGQIEEGLRLVAEALAAFEQSGRGDLLAEAYRLQGVLLLHRGAAEAVHAEACFQQALTIARRQQAKSWELRAATSLARLWQQQGKRAEARALLAPLCDWFTEGFDTADLQDARALLEARG